MNNSDERESSSRYAGDDACLSCHEDIYTSFKRTGMGRSVSRFDPTTAPEEFPSGLVISDPNSPFKYSAYVSNDTLFQTEWVEDATGEIVSSRTVAMDWVIGSGNATRSYLINSSGFVTEAPLTWYVHKKKWDLSPAYSQKNERFSRPIGLECMTCHNAIPGYSPYTLNHYTDVPLGISCERCHGPSQEHVERQLAGFDVREGETIDPANLDRSRQLAICQQCHLTGLSVFRPGADATTFRPGQSLADVRTVFDTASPDDPGKDFGISSHGTRLALSECFTQSTLTCTTCHDPHTPVAELGRDHFNVVCRNCHEPAEMNCTRPLHDESVRMTADCVSCHMQTGGTSDIPHVSFTDHWIRTRLPEERPSDALEIDRVQTTPLSLVRVGPVSDGQPLGQAELQEAVAYFEFYRTKHRLPAYLDSVVVLAQTGLEHGADDENARLALAVSLVEKGSIPEAVAELEDAVAEYPDNADLWFRLGEAYIRAGRSDSADAAFSSAIRIQPLFVDAIVARADGRAAAGRMKSAVADYRDALRKDPTLSASAWNNLGVLLLRSDSAEVAVPAFRMAVELDPILPAAVLNYGSSLLATNQNLAAIPVLQRALELEPESIPALGNLGIAFTRTGDRESAMEMFRSVLRLSPNDANATRLLRALE